MEEKGGRAGLSGELAGAHGGFLYGDRKPLENNPRPAAPQASYAPSNIQIHHNRVVALAELRALVRVLAGPAGADAVDALTEAMRRPDDPAALDWAQVEFERLPRRQFRRVLATFAALRWGAR